MEKVEWGGVLACRWVGWEGHAEGGVGSWPIGGVGQEGQEEGGVGEGWGGVVGGSFLSLGFHSWPQPTGVLSGGGTRVLVQHWVAGCEDVPPCR
jgi:hypothetical protein